MHPYIIETEYASRNLLSLALNEEEKLEDLKKSLATAEAKFKNNNWDFTSSDLNDDFSDAYVIDAFNRMAKAAIERDTLQQEISEIQAILGAKQSAIQAICSAVLQIAKQGISLVYGGLNGAPDGRNIGSLTLKDIIWQSRNQALHFEEGQYRKPVIEVFSILENEHGKQFSLTSYQCQSRAKQVVKLLGWQNYDAYLKDMKQLLPLP